MLNRLSEVEIQSRLKELSYWSLKDDGQIVRVVTTKNFASALLLANSVGFLAEARNHHPDILIQYNKVTFCLITHEANGLTHKDFELAADINSLLG